jgi:hypothetical protein
MMQIPTQQPRIKSDDQQESKSVDQQKSSELTGGRKDGPMLSLSLIHDDADEDVVAFLLWCLPIHRAEQERKRKMR